MRKARAVALVALGLLALAGCAPRKVLREGRTMTVDEAVALDVEASRAAMERGELPQALAKLAETERAYPDSPLLEQVWWLRFQIQGRRGDSAGALRSLGEISRRFPSGTLVARSHIEEGVLLLRLERPREALAALEPVAREARSPADRARAAFLVGEAEVRLGDRVAAVLWGDRAQADFPDESGRGAAAEFVREMILHRLTEAELKSLLQETGGRPPGDAIRLKLALLAQRDRRWDEAKDQLDRLVASFPASPLKPQAEDLLREIAERKKVRPDTIGLLLTLSGPAAEYGQRALRGAMLAAEAFSSGRSTAPPPIEVIVRDDHGLAAEAERGLEDLVLEGHVAGVVGPMLAAPARAAALRAQGLEVPLLSLYPSADLPRLGPSVFLVGLPPASQARLVARYAMETLGLRTFALLYPKELYGRELMGAFWDEVRARGGEVTGVEGYDPDDTDFGPEIRKLVGTHYLDLRQDDRKRWEHERSEDLAAGQKRPPREVWRPEPVIDFEGLFIPDYYLHVALILPQLTYYDVRGIQLLGTSGWDNPQLLKLARGNIDRAIYPALFVPRSSRPEVKRFVEAYESAYGEEPDLVAALAYDGVRILREFLGTPSAQSRSALTEALRHLGDFPGVSGTTSFAGSGEPHKEVFLLQVRGGTLSEVGTMRSP